LDLAKLKQAEDEIVKVVDGWPKWTQAVAYLYLYNLGIRVADVGKIIQDGLKAE